ncbi:helix-turn-helix domain-containing protein [Oceanobacillus sp. CAU 1775]
MIETGSFIKLQRTKQKMTLGELAEGIVSVSYLSKIENLKTEPSPNIIELLCNRLGIELHTDMEDVIKEKCEEWYQMLSSNHEKGELIETYQEIQDLLDRNISESMLLFEIYKIRYYLILGEKKEALKQINELNRLTSSFGTKELYYWFKFRGNYNSTMNENKSAIEKYQKAENIIRKLDISQEEIADLHYTMAITYSKLRQILEAIDYANQALDIFMKKYNFNRCAQCHIVLGISYRRIKMYDKAIKNYDIAKHLASLDNNNEIIQLTNQNLGYLHSAKGNNLESIKFYMEIIEGNDIDTIEKIAAMTQLIKIYYEVDNVEAMNEFMEESRKLIDNFTGHPDYEFYNYLIYTYYYSTHNKPGKFTELVKNKFIPFLKKHRDYVNLIDISTMLAKHYEDIHKYKDATKYYKLANESMNKLSNI